MLLWVIAAIVVAGILVIAAALIAHRGRSDRLRHADPEHDGTVGGLHGGSGPAGDGRDQQVEIPPRALSPVDREAFSMEWATVERRFADDPAAAIGTADLLVNRVMTDCGYPMTNFEQKTADGSAIYPAPIEGYRAAHEIVTRHHDGGAGAEELQQAMVRFRSLFDALLGPPPAPSRVEPINRRRRIGHERAS